MRLKAQFVRSREERVRRQEPDVLELLLRQEREKQVVEPDLVVDAVGGRLGREDETVVDE